MGVIMWFEVRPQRPPPRLSRRTLKHMYMDVTPLSIAAEHTVATGTHGVHCFVCLASVFGF